LLIDVKIYLQIQQTLARVFHSLMLYNEQYRFVCLSYELKKRTWW